MMAKNSGPISGDAAAIFRCGIAAGLLIGKPSGIALMCFMADSGHPYSNSCTGKHVRIGRVIHGMPRFGILTGRHAGMTRERDSECA